MAHVKGAPSCVLRSACNRTSSRRRVVVAQSHTTHTTEEQLRKKCEVVVVVVAKNDGEIAQFPVMPLVKYDGNYDQVSSM